MSGNSPKPLEATARNAQRSTATPTPTDSVAAIPDQDRGQASDRGSLTIELKPFGVLEATLVEKIAVAHCRRSCVLSSSLGAFRIFRYHYAIERKLYESSDACGLSRNCDACKTIAAFSTFSPRRNGLLSKIKKLPNKPI